MEKLSNEQETIKILFKDFLIPYNSRSISKVIGISHAGEFKILKKLEKRQILKSIRIGNALIYSLNKENQVAWREIELALTLEARNYLRWIEEFKNISNRAEFAVLFGSIIKDEKAARDIDLLVVANKNQSKEINRLIDERRKFLDKKVHLIIQTPKDFKHDLINKNRAVIEIIKKGIVLFGQGELVKMFF